jgi:quercetin dioxygenase-like cupin family protein
MIAVRVQDLELIEGGFVSDPAIRGRFNFPIHAGTGAMASAAIYFEIMPGQAAPPHSHTAEEILYLADGTAEVIVGDERGTFPSGGLVLIPALIRHEVRNVGKTILRCVGFFASAAMLTTFDQVLTPVESRVLVVPMPDEIVASYPASARQRS